eukprot:CAMPEP_0170513590 /NCGR_PEP_ID=MMETSP0209-20121228/104_1 /TAXON_ID=665100 ORGANISM="Litonotus pictus, Strain P1" /NCGR_SAMPLE_ID=MMETSP0209 /ASSEMBLY_ACC=CAM_ASM_000301 /LENGTH=242 /DNA_ID=CAMNT_0010797343 /DNA_START=1 /DNA_END=725 /DNA_ORIENTATION=+
MHSVIDINKEKDQNGDSNNNNDKEEQAVDTVEPNELDTPFIQKKKSENDYKNLAGRESFNRKYMYKKIEKSSKWRIVFLMNVFLACVSFSIVLPTLWPYLLRFGCDETFLASVLAIYSIGEFFGAIIWGYVYNKFSATTSLYSAIFLGFLGSVLYSAGGYFIPEGKWLVFAGRFVQGLWTGAQQAVEQAYITEAVEKQDSLALRADIGAASVLGFVLGPVVGLFGRLFFNHLPQTIFDEYTS